MVIIGQKVKIKSWDSDYDLLDAYVVDITADKQNFFVEYKYRRKGDFHEQQYSRWFAIHEIIPLISEQLIQAKKTIVW